MDTFLYICTMEQGVHIVAFTGHREYDGSANEALGEVVDALYRAGARTFRVGMAEGFDLAAAEAVMGLMSQADDVVLEACVPWSGFHQRFSAENRVRYEAVLVRATVVRYVATHYDPTVFHRRNDMLVAGADVVVAWWCGKPSGTGYTVGRAKKCGARVVNLYPDSQLSIAF